MPKYLAVFLSVMLFAFVGVAHADFPAPFPLLKSVNLVLKVNGAVAKSTITVQKGDQVEVTWSSAGKGCVNNWDSSTAPSDNVGYGNILNANRLLVITCYGLGTAQTTKVQVNVGTPDLSAASFKITNLASVPKKTGEYYAANIDSRTALTLSGTVKNSGKLNVAGATYEFQYSSNGGTTWFGFGKTPLPTPFKPGTNQNVSYIWSPGADKDAVYITQLCTFVPASMTDGNSKNDCTTPSKSMKFISH